MPRHYGDGEGEVLGDSVVVVVVLVSDETVALGLAPGATVSVFCSQAASSPTVRMTQMYFLMRSVVGEKDVGVNPNF
jgi:hypothetical protein